MSKIKAGDSIKVHYTGKLSDGTVFDSSREREPLAFDVEAGMMIPGFDKAVVGMSVGESKTVVIEAADAYGEVRDDMIADFPLSSFPEHVKPEVGQELSLNTESGKPLNVVVSKVENDTVTLDGNHFLAGKDLTFDIEIVEIA